MPLERKRVLKLAQSGGKASTAILDTRSASTGKPSVQREVSEQRFLHRIRTGVGTGGGRCPFVCFA